MASAVIQSGQRTWYGPSKVNFNRLKEDKHAQSRWCTSIGAMRSERKLLKIIFVSYMWRWAFRPLTLFCRPTRSGLGHDYCLINGRSCMWLLPWFIINVWSQPFFKFCWRLQLQGIHGMLIRNISFCKMYLTVSALVFHVLTYCLWTNQKNVWVFRAALLVSPGVRWDWLASRTTGRTGQRPSMYLMEMKSRSCLLTRTQM